MRGPHFNLEPGDIAPVKPCMRCGQPVEMPEDCLLRHGGKKYCGPIRIDCRKINGKPFFDGFGKHIAQYLAKD